MSRLIRALTRWLLMAIYGPMSLCQAGETEIGNNGEILGFTLDVFGPAFVGQTFTATVSGSLKKIGVAVEAGETRFAELYVFSGQGMSGGILHSQGVDLMSVDTVTSPSEYGWYSITIDRAVPITSGQVYTFVFAADPQIKLGFKFGEYDGGGLFHSNPDVVEWDVDLVFWVAQSAAPSVGNAVAGQTVNDTATLRPFANLTIADPDSDVTATVALDDAAKGVFTGPAFGWSTNDGGATYTHASTSAANIQASIRELVFNPTDNRVEPGSTETTWFTVTVSDGVETPATNDVTTVVSTSVNDAPLIGAGTYVYSGSNEDTTSSSVRILDMFGSMGYTDIDAGTVPGIAITAGTAYGTWQYSLDGSTGWTAFVPLQDPVIPPLSDSHALLLDARSYVRFVPDGLNGGTAALTFRAWDHTLGVASSNDTPRYADTRTNGGSAAFSAGTANASIAVSSVNDAPAFVGGVTTLTANENAGATSIGALLHASDVDHAQTLTWTQSVAPAHGTLAFSSATASTPGTDIAPGGTITYTPAGNYAGSDSFTVQVSDGTASASRTINVTVNPVATELRFTTQPSGSVSGAALTGQPVVTATDSSGRVDTSFTGNVTLVLGSGAGALAGTLVEQAVAGVATFTNVRYIASADQQAFTLVTWNAASLTNATSTSVTSDVVATKLRFETQPAPLTLASTVTRTFTTAPVVRAVDPNGTLDTTYAADVVLSLTAGDGTAAPGAVSSVAAPGDTDAVPTAVTLPATGGVVIFAGLSVNYTNSGGATEVLALHVTSGGLTAENSIALSSRINAVPSVDCTPSGLIFEEGGAAVVVSTLVTVNDADDSTMPWATVSIVQNFTAGQDVLSFTNDGINMGNIAAAYDASTGVLTLSSAGATATLSQWARALRSVNYSNTSESPNTATRALLFVVNDGFVSSDAGYAFARASVVVSGTNDAPTLSGGPFALNGTDEDTMSTATAVSTILAGLTYADADGSVASGIAITQKTGTGSWAYSTDGVSWRAIGTVRNTSALLLTSTSRVRYMPNGVEGETATLTFRGWDQTSGTASNNTPSLADPSTNGGTTAFSTGAAQASLTVASVNDAPVIGGALAGQTVADSSSLSPFATATINDPDSNVAATLAPDAAAKGVFTAASLAASGFTSADGGATYTCPAATPAAVQAALRQLVFAPTANRVAVGLTETTRFTVTVSDGAAVVSDNTTTVVSTSGNDAPTQVALGGGTVGQGSGANAIAGALGTTDPDVGDTFTYALVAGAGSTDNAAFNVSGASLRANDPAALSTGSHSVRVRSTDAGGLWVEQALVVTVTDDLGPTVSSVTGPAAGKYRCGDALEFTVKFNDSVTVTGTPKLNLTVGAAARAATYVSGSGTTDLLFRYTIVQGDHAASGEVVIGTLDVTGAAIRDAAGNDATLTFTPPALPGVLVDALTHSADTNVDWKIGLLELTRVIELYNTRSGTNRTGEYHVESGTEDGFAPGAGALTSWHSADCNHDGRLSLVELTRVIELYNTRTGTTRTGDYHAVGGTEDGFAPGSN